MKMRYRVALICWSESEIFPRQKANLQSMRIFFSKAIKFFVGVLLLPIIPPTIMEIWKHSHELDEHTFWIKNPLSLCLGGLVLWVVFTSLFHLPSRVYVFAHELTHALFVKICGGKVKKISVKQNSGYVLSDRNNFLIVLAPYLFPFYAVFLGLSAGITNLFIPLSQFQVLLWGGIGVCLGYHWTMTLKMLTTHQSDFTSQGYFFSVVFILTMNLLFLLLIFLFLSTPRSFSSQMVAFVGSVAHSYRTFFTMLTQWICKGIT